MGILSSLLVRIISLVVAVLALLSPLYWQNRAQLEKDKAWQTEHLAELEQQKAEGTVYAFEEGRFFAGDLEKALDGDLKFNELRFVATHNSYQNESVSELQMWYGVVGTLSFGAVPKNGGAFQTASLTDQLNGGVRSLELDVETMRKNGKTSFVCLHSPVLDMTTHSYDFALAMREIDLWSDMHPGHLPVTVIVEPKVAMLPLWNMDAFTLAYANTMDDLLKTVLGEKLFTPADMLRGYETFAEMRKADDWCRVEDMCGKVLVLLHPTVVTNGYIRQDKTLRTQAMFPMLRASQAESDYASFVVENNPLKAESDKERLIDREKCVVRTRPDSFGKLDEEIHAAAKRSGAQILSTDYPPLPGVETPFCFSNGATITDICWTS